jgi:hypothetical protein
MSAPPTKRLTDLLVRKAGASVPAPRTLLAEVLAAHEALAAEKAAVDAELAAARVTVARAEALQRAVLDPTAAAKAVTVERLRAYLRVTGWATGVAEGYWQRDGFVTDVPPDEAMRDYAARVLACAREVAHAEGRPQALVLADWLVAT